MNFCLHEVNEYDLNRLDEIGAAYSTFGNLDNALKKLWCGKLTRIDHLENLVSDFRIILKWILTKSVSGRMLCVFRVWV